MAPETLTTNERVSPERAPEVVRSRREEARRNLALRHLECVRRFKQYLSVYLLAMLVLTPIWIVTQYETADGWPEHLSTRSRYPGDWDPWIIWVALVGGIIVAVQAYRAYFKRETEDEVEHEVERLKSIR